MRILCIGLLVALSGCGSINLKGIVEKACGDEQGQAIVTAVQVQSPALGRRPSNDLLLGERIDAQSIQRGASVARLNFALDGTAAPSASERTVEAARKARVLLNTAWKELPTSVFAADTNLASTTSGGATSERFEIKITGGKTENLLKDIGEIVQANGFEGLQAANLAAMNDTAEKESQRKHENKAAAFLSRYFEAYFRGGRVFQVGLNAKLVSQKLGEDLTNAIGADRLKKEPDLKARVDKLISSFEAQLTAKCPDSKDKEQCVVSKALGKDSFVSRAGMEIQFGGVTATIGANGGLTTTLSHPQSTEVVPQVVRVFWEAVMDAAGTEVPAVANSTACSTAEGQALFDSAMCLKDGDARAARIKRVDEYAAKADGAASAGAASVIRGLNIAALNNEAVAKGAEAYAGVFSRKLVEKAVWHVCRGSSVPVVVSVEKAYF